MFYSKYVQSSFFCTWKYRFEWPDELQNVERNFLREIETLEKDINFRDHSVLFYQIIEKKISLLKEYLEVIEASPAIILDELAALVDQRLEEQERAMDKSNDLFETDKIFTNIRILGWIKYLIVEKDGRIPNRPDWED
ncbi:MAG TPA: hypothetical protein VH415_07440 [Nitrososphaeraceae archaeon]